ncbi:1-phosphofructokinase family hexose kinase [Caulobacter sp. KR2-114]|uniref:1-phosphofructokinase family hexose kinase n=1 Tax=Caulobacter sp. KR2-114 TaxID=3400912 RepID=UPI003BFF1E21
MPLTAAGARLPPGGRIVALTFSPCVDVTFEVDAVRPGSKLRGRNLRRDPGGGGVNIARVLRHCGREAEVVLPAGGPTGERLLTLLAGETVRCRPIVAEAETREDFTAVEPASGREYRFVLPAPPLSQGESDHVVETAVALTPGGAILAASGSLPPDGDSGLYATVARRCRDKGVRLALDAPARDLRPALAQGAWLIKPNLDELTEVAGRPLPDRPARLDACRTLLARFGLDWVAASFGADGALLVGRQGAWAAAAPAVTPVSTVGAGDSFLGVLLDGLARDAEPAQALVRAVAAGAAALLSPGVQLCRLADIDRLQPAVSVEALGID